MENLAYSTLALSTNVYLALCRVYRSIYNTVLVWYAVVILSLYLSGHYNKWTELPLTYQIGINYGSKQRRRYIVNLVTFLIAHYDHIKRTTMINLL